MLQATPLQMIPLLTTSSISVWLHQALALQYSADLLERRFDVPRGESYLTQTLDIGKLLTSMFQHNNSLGKAEPALEEADFVDHVHPRLMLSILQLILGR